MMNRQSTAHGHMRMCALDQLSAITPGPLIGLLVARCHACVCNTRWPTMWLLTRSRPGVSQAGALLRTLANWATVDPAAISGKKPATCHNIG